MNKQNKQIIFKARMGEDLRRWTCPDADAITLELVQAQMQSMFLTTNTLIRFEDDDGDLCTLDSPSDLAEAIALADSQDSSKITVRLDIRDGNGMHSKPAAMGFDAAGVSTTEAVTAKSSGRKVVLTAKNENDDYAACAGMYTSSGQSINGKPVYLGKDRFIFWNHVARKWVVTAMHYYDSIQQDLAQDPLRNVGGFHFGTGNSLEGSLWEKYEAEAAEAKAEAEAAEAKAENAAEAKTEMVVHSNIVCDLCDMYPLVGPRFKKCGEDFDACQKCYDSLNAAAKSAFQCIGAPNRPDSVATNLVNVGSVEDAIAVMGLDESDLTVSMVAEIQTGLQEAVENDKEAAAEAKAIVEAELKEAAEVEAKAIAEAEVRAAAEAEAKEAADSESVKIATVEDAISVMGLDESDLTVSMVAEIQTGLQEAVENDKEAAAEAKAIVEAELKEAAEVEAKAIAEAEAEEARRLAEAKAAAEAEVKAIAEAEARAAAEAEANDEAEAKEAADAESVKIATVEDALAVMGLDESDLTVSMVAEIQTAVLQGAAAKTNVIETMEDSPVDDWRQEWDSMLEDLNEMGFHNNAANREVLASSRGNLQGAVKELVTAERARPSPA